MYERVVEILKDFVEVDKEQITGKANLINDLGLNSLEVVHVVIAFEEKFGIEVPDEDIVNLVTVEDIVAYLEKR